MATGKDKSRTLAFPSEMGRMAEGSPANRIPKGVAKIHREATRGGGVVRHKSHLSINRSPVKDAAEAEMQDKPLTIKSIKKGAKAEFRKLKEHAEHRYIERVEHARRHYLKDVVLSREAYQRAKQTAREEMERQVVDAKDKFKFTVDMAREMHTDTTAAKSPEDTGPPPAITQYAQSLSVEQELRQAVLDG